MLIKKDVLLAAAAALFFSACNSDNPKVESDPSGAMASLRAADNQSKVERGQYLVTVASCADCHSPKVMMPQGPVEDSTRRLSGHPASMQMPPVHPEVLKPGAWAQMSQQGTAFAGPWGISYSANLTPDSATGIGAWTEEVFIKSLRSGKHLGQPSGRQILPPMPWIYISKMTDEDLSAMYTYLRSLPAVSNRVPAPIPPNEVKTTKE